MCLESLFEHAPASCSITVLDDATPDDSVRIVCEEAGKSFSNFRYVKSNENRGFVKSCNWGWQEIYEPGSDVLLLNSDTEVTAGFLQEMQTVLSLHEKHAITTPRSNNATLYSIPAHGDRLPPAASFDLWQKIRLLLPRYQVMPTAVGFCMLIKGEVLERFGLFDEVYSPGYNEENDFVCRINRYGYSAVSANWAYVFHYESSSFGPRRAALEAANGKRLMERWPEYPRKVSDYVQFQRDPVDHFAPLYAQHRPRILYDLFHLPSKHCGTSEFALSLLREIGRTAENEFDLYIGIHKEPLNFFTSELRGYRVHSERIGFNTLYDLAFKPSQIFTWAEFQALNRLAPRVCYTLQDIIGLRCDYLSGPSRYMLFRRVAELADRTFTISDFSHSDFQALYGQSFPMNVIYHGTSFVNASLSPNSGSYILVVGNAYAHKGVEQAVEQLQGSGLLVVLGSEHDADECEEGIRRVPSGHLTRQYLRELFAGASLVVYPSHYEGFGLPVLDALALGKPVVVLDTEVNRELSMLVHNQNLHRIDSIKQVRGIVEQLLASGPERDQSPVRSWREAGVEYMDAFRAMLSKDIDLGRLRARWELLRLIQSL